MEAKVIIEQSALHGSADVNGLQRFSTVYIGTVEYRLYAPAKATGNPLDWLEQTHVHRPDGDSEVKAQEPNRSRAIELTRQALETKGHLTQEPKTMTEAATIDKRAVFVVYGRNSKARVALFDFLRAIDLAPMEWEEVIAATGQAAPFIGDALEKGFSIAQAAVVLLTGEDMARVGKRYLKPEDSRDERTLTPQPRPNVLFEAGMAMGKHPDRTVFVSLGSYRKFTDLDGRHLIHLSNTDASRRALAGRLKTAGCTVRTDYRADWLTTGDFDAALLDPDLADKKNEVRLKMFKREAKYHSDATFKNKVWIEFRNESDECLELRHPIWKPGPSGIAAVIRQGTFQLQIGTTWCPEKIGTAQIIVPPGELCRLWADPDKKLDLDTLKKICLSDASLGFVDLTANGETISIPV